MALLAAGICGTAGGCASSKCGTVPIEASHSGKSVDIGSCNGGDFGAPVGGSADQLATVQNRPIHIRVGEQLKFTYHVSDTGYTHGARVTDAAVANLVSAPPAGSTFAVVVGVKPGTTLLTIDPTLLCGDPNQRCAIAEIDVAG